MPKTAAIVISLFVIAALTVFMPGHTSAVSVKGDLDVAIVGSAEYVPGTTNTIQISVQNNKTVSEIEPVASQAGLSGYYGMASGVTAVMSKGNAPITVKTDKVLIGNIASGATTPPISFPVEIEKGAAPGSYQVSLELTYQELSGLTVGQAVNLQWAARSTRKELRINIKQELVTVEESTSELDAVIVGPAEFAPGSINMVQVSVQNNKTLNEQDARSMPADLVKYYNSAVSVTASLRSGTAPVDIKTEKVLLGTLPAGAATPPIPLVIQVRENAPAGTYNMGLDLAYKMWSDTEKGEKINPKWVDRVASNKLKIQIKEKAVEFDAANIEAVLHPGDQKTIKVTFKNSGRQAARGAVARITAIDPLTATDDTAFLGDLAPGARSAGVFGLKIKGDATPKDYALDAQVKYSDSAGEEHLSRIFKVPVKVVSASLPLLDSVAGYLPGFLLGAGIVAAAWVIWFVWFRVKPIVISK